MDAINLDLRSLLIGAALGAAFAIPAAVAGVLAWHAGKQIEREAQSLALALGCGPSAELEVATRHGVGVDALAAAGRSSFIDAPHFERMA